MNKSHLASPNLAGVKTSAKNAPVQSMALVQSRLAFYLLTGFIASQSFQIPIFAIPALNWAIWPCIADCFAVGLVLLRIFTPSQGKKSEFVSKTLTDLIWMMIVFVINFLLVTIPFSTSGEGIKFGAFSLILMSKYILVFWAVIEIPLDKKRLLVLHAAALFAFVSLVGLSLADKFHLIEIDNFTAHLPRQLAGKWASPNLDSTVSATHGGTTVMMLILASLAVGTAYHRFRWLVECIAFALGLAGTFVAASRQGFVRFLSFLGVYISHSPSRFVASTAIFGLILVSVLLVAGESLFEFENQNYQEALQRQSVLLDDPFSSEGLAGRPILWASVIDTLNEEPIRWLVGYGMGNYAEYNNSAHNMILQYMQDGGLVMLIYCSFLWGRIFLRIWQARQQSWVLLSLTAGMFTSVFTSAIFYPNLSTGWYLGLYFVSMYLLLPHESEETLQ